MKRYHLSLTLLGLLLLTASSRAAAAVSCSSCAYITGNGTIYAWESTSGSLQPIVNVPGAAIDSLVFDTKGNIIFDTINPGKIYVFDTTANPPNPNPRVLASVGNNLGDMTLEPDGNNVLVAGRADLKIYRINLNSGAVSTLNSGIYTDGIIYDNTGRLFGVINSGSGVAQLDPATGGIVPNTNQISGLNTADGITISTTTPQQLYVAAHGGFYRMPTDLSSKTPFLFAGTTGMDGIGTAGHYVYIIHYDNTQGYGLRYDLNLSQNQIPAQTQFIPGADDIAPLSGFGSPTPPPTITFSANPTTISAGGSSTLSWTLTNATSASIDQNVGAISPASGTKSVSPANTTTYTLTASGPGGSASAQATVTVNAAPPPTCGDGQCNGAETCSSCALDCGVCPPPPPSAQIQFNPTSYTVNEDAGLATITVTRTGDTSGIASVQFASSNGTATAGQDFLGVSGTLKWNAGDTTKTFDVPLIDDALVESDETVLLTLSTPTGATLGANQATLTIHDNDTSNPPPPPPAPFISELVPYTAPVAYASNFTMRVLGKGFNATGSQVIWNNNVTLPVVSRSTTEIDVTMNPAIWSNTPGSYPVIVRNPGNVNSNQAFFDVRSPGDGNPPPFIVSGPNANPNPTYTKTTTLTAMGGTLSQGGESVLTYEWMLTGTNPSSNVTFTNNVSHAGSSSVATFPGAGTYHVIVRVRDTVTQFAVDSTSVDVVVNRNATSIAVTPKQQTIGVNTPLNLTATVKDQWLFAMTNPAPVWSNSAGTLSSNVGQNTSFSASDAGIGHATITALVHDALNMPLSDSADVTIVVSGAGLGGDLSNAKAYPVPFKSNSGDPGINFTGLAPGTKIRIFTITGHIVQTLNSPNGSDVLWDVKNANLDRVSSGVYMYIMEAAGQKKEGKLVIIQ